MVIFDEMNSTLIEPFLEYEIREVLKQMTPLKAPRPNEMPPLFYQHFWGVVDNNVMSSILSWLNSGTLPRPLNHNFITLIPKIKNPEFVQDYHPISLYNVPYKIFSKV